MSAIVLTREEFLTRRKKGIGGSDVAACLGLNPWRTPVQLWQDKTGKSEPEPTSESAHFGTILEDIVAKEFSARLGMKVQRVNAQLQGSEDWMLANIDRGIVNRDIAGRVFLKEGRLTTDAILECKTASAYSTDLWGETQEYEIKAGQVVTEHQIPLYYETQVQWYMGITGVPVCYLAVLIGGNDFRIYKIDFNYQAFEKIKEKCEFFWKEYVLKDVAPEPINIDDVKRLYRVDSGEMLEATNEQAVDIGELRTIKEKIKELSDQKAAVEIRLTASIGEATGLTLGGEKVVTFKAQTQNRLDSTALKKAAPAVWHSYAKESTNRVLRVF